MDWIPVKVIYAHMYKITHFVEDYVNKQTHFHIQVHHEHLYKKQLCCWLQSFPSFFHKRPSPHLMVHIHLNGVGGAYSSKWGYVWHSLQRSFLAWMKFRTVAHRTLVNLWNLDYEDKLSCLVWSCPQRHQEIVLLCFSETNSTFGQLWWQRLDNLHQCWHQSLLSRLVLSLLQNLENLEEHDLIR